MPKREFMSVSAGPLSQRTMYEVANAIIHITGRDSILPDEVFPEWTGNAQVTITIEDFEPSGKPYKEKTR